MGKMCNDVIEVNSNIILVVTEGSGPSTAAIHYGGESNERKTKTKNVGVRRCSKSYFSYQIYGHWGSESLHGCDPLWGRIWWKKDKNIYV